MTEKNALEIHTITKKHQGVVSNKQKHAAITTCDRAQQCLPWSETRPPLQHMVKSSFFHKPKVATLALSDADSA